MGSKKRTKRTFAEVISQHVSATGQLTGVQLDKDKLYFTSDIHFFHNNIIKYCDRPFSNTDEMNEEIIRRWNDRVPHDGTVFIVGDVALGGRSAAPKLAEILSRLNGRLFLIPGNHDDYLFESDECLEQLEILTPLVEIRVPDPEAKRGRQRIVMSHFAMKIWNKSHHGTWCLYGHSHHSMPPDYKIKSFDVGIDGEGYGYAPISYEFVKNLMLAHGQEVVDHHNQYTT